MLMTASARALKRAHTDANAWDAPMQAQPASLQDTRRVLEGSVPPDPKKTDLCWSSTNRFRPDGCVERCKALLVKMHTD
jgi:hypothetical protein